MKNCAAAVISLVVLLAACAGEAKSPDGNGTICHVSDNKSCVVPWQKMGNSCQCDGQTGYVRFDH